MAKDAAVMIRLADGNDVGLILNVSQEVAKICRDALHQKLPEEGAKYFVAVGGKEVEEKAAPVPVSRPDPTPAPPPPMKTYPHPPTKRFKPKKKGR